MSEFCEKKGIKEEFSNKVLVVKPHNKNPYELFRGRTPALSFMRPFGKAFRVYNIRTRKVEENLHIRFLEDKPIIAGTEESIGAGHSSKETGSSQNYILMPLWKDGSLFDSSSKNASNDERQPSSDAGKKDDEGVSKQSGNNDQERPKNSTQDVNSDGPSINTANTNLNTDSLNINNVSPTVTTTPLEATHTDFFEPKRIAKALSDLAWVEAMQEELLQFKLQKVWVLVDLPKGKRVIGTKWVYRNKKDEIGIVIWNKARLVAHGHS
ncbi:putative ribonuclease H-like domain-containing protein [Tanacetum coccineum]